ncbi:long-chain-fatty-acid--CoA ligase [Deinococcus peraridilitoris]|uniref:Acyl-CoA synthetase (AMP-forming)/AMP-acid ligase II n=1 Tax=Deinococcus peraridilitoris (strain DSM 19664 / LMG 22246 / CIP 109416 / KR-200) TaxID=937777 RepID=L0A3J9_DEIPD|nr:long-chain-fatty-acid--CoA ligase [Deinococcus peraridilitoris]AFZ68421.1 acyl-CoA synthetase (AMP-forming)/AMP-acid ligase II [Deinococcus peraridilitoris DSM 19664]
MTSRSAPLPSYWPEGVPRFLTTPRSSLYHNLETTAARFPDKVGLWFYGRELTFAELLRDAARLSGHLQRQGVGKGDRVLVWLQNSPQFVTACHAVWRAGGVVVPLSPMLTAQELSFFLADAGIRVGVVGAELYTKARAAGLGHAVVANCCVGTENSPVPVPETLQADEHAEGGDVTWAQALSGAEGEVVPVGFDDLAVMPYTSGTTGRPKGCMHTHGNVQANVHAAGVWVRSSCEDISLGTLPFFHVTGLVNSMLSVVAGGSKLVMMARWDRVTAITLIREQGCTLWTNTATMIVDLLAQPGLTQEDFRSLRRVSGGGAPLPEAVGRRFEELAGFRFLEGYGLSETMAQTHTNPPQAPKLQCLGVPIPSTQARIIDPETLTELGPGETGEIVVSGPQVMQGYWQRPEANAEAFVELGGTRFLRSGDLGYVDDEGYFFMVDRLKRMINAAGLKVWPAEVENVLYKHPAVLQACVISVPDERTGERARALIVLREGQSATGEQIAEWAREHLAAYKIPRDWQIVDGLPVAGTGKINWRALQEQVRQTMTAPSSTS